MIRIFLIFLIVASSSSCVVWRGLDPAESLGERAATEAIQLRNSKDHSRIFEFDPESKWFNFSSGSAEGLTIMVYPSKENGNSVLSVSDQSNRYTTTYHSRELLVPRLISSTKKSNRPFTVTLQRSGNQILWKDVK
jgi:hypothetical protein